MKKEPKRSPYRVYPAKGAPEITGLGTEWICPECGTIFLVQTDAWSYTLKGTKYCRYNCLRAAETKKKSK